MILLKKANVLAELLAGKKKYGKNIGFVPTMGALHMGHISLITASKKENDITVSSIFINPVQFNDPKDFQKYPVTLDKDIYMLESSGCDILFLPAVSEIYPEGVTGLPQYDLGYLETILEGRYRPGHFQGVCQVVQRLLDVVKPGTFYLGQKDFQQYMVIKKLMKLTGKDNLIKLNIGPTLRESDGLAMSSRNMRLSEEERKKAVAVSESLLLIKNRLAKGQTSSLKEEAEGMLVQAGFKVDYVEIADIDTLESVAEWDGKQKLVALAAASINGIRLIDNMFID